MQKFPGFRIPESIFPYMGERERVAAEKLVWFCVLCDQYEDLLTVAQKSFTKELHGVLAKKKSLTMTKALADVQSVSLFRKILFPDHCCFREY